MLYKATHTTKYSYNAAVSQCQSEVRLTPRTLPWQTLVELTIQTMPPPASVESHQDYFGNEVRTFTILESHDRFSTVATSLVEVEPRESSVVSDVAWEHVRDELAAHSSFDTLEAFEFVFDSPHGDRVAGTVALRRRAAFRRGGRSSRPSRTSHTASTPNSGTRPRPRASTRRSSMFCASRRASVRTSPT